MNHKMKKALTYMRANYSQRLTFEQLAQRAATTPAHLARMFKSETGMTPIAYLKQLRLEQAKRLLETTPQTFKEIAFAVGATDESHFRRDFKRAYGTTPKRYREDYLDKIFASDADKPFTS